MSDKEILEKAIQKAIDGGWVISNAALLGEIASTRDILFNHEFAKALFGTENPYEISRTEDGLHTHTFGGPAWQFHLQQMVIAEDPIAYLGVNI